MTRWDRPLGIAMGPGSIRRLEAALRIFVRPLYGDSAVRSCTVSQMRIMALPLSPRSSAEEQGTSNAKAVGATPTGETIRR